MSRLLNTLLALLILVAVGGVVLVFSVLEPSALVVNRDRLGAEEVRELAEVAKRTDAQQGRDRTISLTPDKLDAIVDYAASRAGAAARLVPGDELVALEVSVPVRNDLGYANFHIELLETEGVPDIVSAQIGPLNVPPALADSLLKRGLKELAFIGELLHADFEPRETRLTFRLAPDVDSAAAALLGNEEVRRLQVRQGQLRSIFSARPIGTLDFAEILSELIAQPTGITGENGMPDPIGDNRTALTVLAVYFSGKPMPIAGTGEPLPYRQVTLHGRADFPKHFAISAALSAKGGSKLANTIGVAKELYDADGGSGFSFADLLANRSGIRFAELATGSTRSAQYVRLRARRGLLDTDLLPSPAGLQEGMQRDALEQTIGSTSSREYARIIRRIDQRIGMLGLYRSLPGS